ncbi:hypothetical protein QFZ82_007586 [Streptomyces sp. V4I23]|nr:hypothetical protein [Streptomyces sp. V4I23]
MLVCPSGVDLSSSTLRFLSSLLRADLFSAYSTAQTRRRPVALRVLAHLRCGHSYAKHPPGPLPRDPPGLLRGTGVLRAVRPGDPAAGPQIGRRTARRPVRRPRTTHPRGARSRPMTPAGTSTGAPPAAAAARQRQRAPSSHRRGQATGLRGPRWAAQAPGGTGDWAPAGKERVRRGDEVWGTRRWVLATGSWPADTSDAAVPPTLRHSRQPCAIPPTNGDDNAGQRSVTSRERPEEPTTHLSTTHHAVTGRRRRRLRQRRQRRQGLLGRVSKVHAEIGVA